MTKYYAFGAVVVVVLVILGMVFITMSRDEAEKYAQCRVGQVAGGSGAIGGPFTLVDETGKTVTSAEFIDEPSLIYFGYTFCPDVCPLDASRNAEAVEILEDRGKIVKPVFISVDPDRDTPEILQDFTDRLHPRMVGLTGSMEQVRTTSQAYRTYFKKHEPESGDEEYYLLDHSTFSYLVFPEEGFIEFFRRDLTPGQLADQVGCFLDQR
ncbi:SCO family protein [Aquicoccus porphyridii]|uniref:SCO family protein n=1 Tax=Aquicoccus porphyridii TaxID=1852029 RepID=UPI00273DE520|nr:SCO family protein [Aquicoccus porphyridii]